MSWRTFGRSFPVFMTAMDASLSASWRISFTGTGRHWPSTRSTGSACPVWLPQVTWRYLASFDLDVGVFVKIGDRHYICRIPYVGTMKEVTNEWDNRVIRGGDAAVTRGQRPINFAGHRFGFWPMMHRLPPEPELSSIQGHFRALQHLRYRAAYQCF